MDFLPIFLNIRDGHTLIVGGGEVAARKTSLLIKAQARIQIVSPKTLPYTPGYDSGWEGGAHPTQLS